MSSKTACRVPVLQSRAGAFVLVSVASIGCRDYTCFDTATCPSLADASVSSGTSDSEALHSEAPHSELSEGPLHSAPSNEPSTSAADEKTSLSGSSTADNIAGLEQSGESAEPTTDRQSPSDTAGDIQPVVEDTSSGSAGNASNTSVVSGTSLPSSPDDPSSTAQSVDTEDVGVDVSAGCGKANPQTGSANAPLTVSNHQYYVNLPEGYDPNTPYPVIIMFNPTGNPISWAEGAAGFETAAADWIRVYPHMANQSNGWGAGDVSFFAPFYEKITSDYCMDTSRIFAAGESSGGDFVGILGCEHADKLRSVAPCATKHVNGYDLDASVRQCTGQVTAVVIHGQNDNVVGTSNGPKMRDFYKQLNHCQDSTTPVESYTDTLSNCVKFEGCDPGYDTYWCNHTDPEYNGTNHGWPKFAAKMLVETWAEL